MRESAAQNRTLAAPMTPTETKTNAAFGSKKTRHRKWTVRIRAGARSTAALSRTALASQAKATHAVAKTLLNPTGQVSQGRAYHRSCGWRRTASMTLGSKEGGALGGGRPASLRLTADSSSAGFIPCDHQLSEGFTAPVNIRLHLRQRNAQQSGDVAIAVLLEVKQDERHALMLRQAANFAF